MVDFFEYLKWRGDLDFDVSPFNEVDALILCQIAYLNFSELVKEEGLTYEKLAESFKLAPDFSERKKVGLLINAKTSDLFFEVCKTKRFNSVIMKEYYSKYDEKKEEQFCAITNYIGDKDRTIFVVFRGTDDSIIGWKEDFNLAFMDRVPSQKDALLYLKKVINSEKVNKVIVAGHSKGGNLSIYACANLEGAESAKVEKIYNFDGPGFSKEDIKSSKFRCIKERTFSYYPQSSIIGMLFEHFSNYKVINSSENLVMQHDPFSWNVTARNFEYKDKLDKISSYFYKRFNSWYLSLDKEKRKQFVDSLFDTLAASNAKSLSSLSEHFFSSAAAIIKAFADMDGDVRKENIAMAIAFIKMKD